MEGKEENRSQGDWRSRLFRRVLRFFFFPLPTYLSLRYHFRRHAPTAAGDYNNNVYETASRVADGRIGFSHDELFSRVETEHGISSSLAGWLAELIDWQRVHGTAGAMMLGIVWHGWQIVEWLTTTMMCPG